MDKINAIDLDETNDVDYRSDAKEWVYTADSFDMGATPEIDKAYEALVDVVEKALRAGKISI